MSLLLLQLDLESPLPTATGYWMPLLLVKQGIVVIVTPLKLLGKQFVEVLAENRMNAVSTTAVNASNELFKVTDLVVYNGRWSVKTDCACGILQKVAMIWYY